MWNKLKDWINYEYWSSPYDKMPDPPEVNLSIPQYNFSIGNNLANWGSLGLGSQNWGGSQPNPALGAWAGSTTRTTTTLWGDLSPVGFDLADLAIREGLRRMREYKAMASFKSSLKYEELQSAYMQMQQPGQVTFKGAPIFPDPQSLWENYSK